MVIVRQFGPRPVAWGILAWAFVVDVCLFVIWTAGHAGISHGAAATASWVAGLLTAAVGFWLGWRHRSGTAFLAPFLAWALVVPFAFVSGFIQSGFFAGLVKGVWLSVAVGFAAAVVEGMVLVVFAILGRVTSGALGRGTDSGVVIIPPRTG